MEPRGAGTEHNRYPGRSDEKGSPPAAVQKDRIVL